MRVLLFPPNEHCYVLVNWGWAGLSSHETLQKEMVELSDVHTPLPSDVHTLLLLAMECVNQLFHHSFLILKHYSMVAFLFLVTGEVGMVGEREFGIVLAPCHR